LIINYIASHCGTMDVLSLMSNAIVALSY